MKRFYLIFAFILLSMELFAYKGDLSYENVDGIYYIYNDNYGTATVTYRSNLDNYKYNKIAYTGSVVIPSTVKYKLKTYSVTSIDKYAFYGCSELTSITIPNSITSIGDNAFNGCSGLTSITIPNSITSIGSHAFDGCSGLTKIIVPDIAKWCSISFGTYGISNPLSYTKHLYSDNNTEITNLIIPEGVTSINYIAFKECSGLTAITFPSSVTHIGRDAFKNTTWYNNQPDGLVYAGNVAYTYKGTMPENTSVTLKEGTVSINDDAFNSCSGLTSITIPSSVTSIGDRAFYGCSNLTDITIPSSVTSIGDDALDGCSGLTSVTILSNSISQRFNGITSIKSVVIGDEVTSIHSSAFSGCLGLTSVTMGNSVTSIGKYAFHNCSSLTSVTIPNSVMSIGDGAFQSCSELTSINIPEGVTSIPSSAFEGCTNLKKVNINSNAIISKNNYPNYIKTIFGEQVTNYVLGNKITSIGSNVFRDCANLTSITIPSSLTSIGESAFYGCTGLKKVIIPDIANWCGISFANDYTNPLWYAGHIYFDDFREITFLDIPDNVTSIGDRAFKRCTNLFRVTIPEGVTSIGEEAFNQCGGVNYVSIPSSVQTIGKRAFASCLLFSINIPNGVKRIGEGAFSYNKLSGIVSIPNSVEHIGTEAFLNNDIDKVILNSDKLVSTNRSSGGSFKYIFGEQVTEYIIGEDVESIGTQAFSFCTDLRSVTIGSKVKKLGNNIFEGCKKIKTINSFITSPFETSEKSFYVDTHYDFTLGITVISYLYYYATTLYVPKGTLSDYTNTASWNKFHPIIEFDITAVQEISGSETEAKVTGNYSIDGKRLVQPQSGLNLQKLSNGKTIKVMKR